MRHLRTMTGILFVGLLGLGLWIASQRPLWTDEYCSLVSSTFQSSYKTIVIGHVGEGNNSPLFYFLQKVQCDLFSYRPPQAWVDGHWGGGYTFDQFFVRIQSVIFLSAALSALFYYFARRFSLLAGAYTIVVAMTCALFWFHWTEARPYALWMTLTVFQILLLLDILENPGNPNKKRWNCLFLVHGLMALTISLSMVQILAAVIVLAIFRRPKLLVYLPLFFVPLGICSYYYTHSSPEPYFFVDGPVALINASLPKDRLFIIFASAIVFMIQCRGKNLMQRVEIKYLVFLILMLGGFGLVLFKLHCSQAPVGQGFQVSSRYFLPLLPAGIVGTVFFSVYLMRAGQSKLARVIVLILLAGLLVFRAQKTPEIHHLIDFTRHSIL